MISPNGGGESPIDYYLSKVGPIPYHICYSSKCIEKDIKDLEQKRFKVTVSPAQAIAFGGKRVVFLMHRTVGMIEIVEE